MLLFAFPVHKSENEAYFVSIEIVNEKLILYKIGVLEIDTIRGITISFFEKQNVFKSEIMVGDLLKYLGFDSELEPTKEDAEKLNNAYNRIFLYKPVCQDVREFEERYVPYLCLFVKREEPQIKQFINREVDVILGNKENCQRGVRIDVKKLEERIYDFENKIFTLSADIDWDIDEGIRSPKKIWEKCRELGVEPPPSLSYKDEGVQEWLDRYGERVNFVRAVLEIGKHKPVQDKLKKIKESLVGDRATIELEYYGTHTGRFTGHGYNVHSLPDCVRDLFLPDEGDVMLIADFEQIEPRILSKLIFGSFPESNPYEEYARKILNIKCDNLKQVNPAKYEEIKVLFLRSAYMPSDFELRKHLPQGIAYRNKLWDYFFYVYGTNKKIWTDFELPTNRMLYFYNLEKKNDRNAYFVKYTPHGETKKFHRGSLLENVVSGIARDIFLDKLKLLYRNKVKVLFHIHDEFVISCKREEVEDIRKLLFAPTQIYKNELHTFPISTQVVNCFV